jgi:hypothetical protein
MVGRLPFHLAGRRHWKLFSYFSHSSDFVFDVGETLNVADASPETANNEANGQFALDL